MKIFQIKQVSLVFCLAGTLMLFASKSAVAQKVEGIEESLQEFFIGETVYAQDKDEVQLTLKPAFWKKEGEQIINIPLQFEYGFTDRFQIELELPYGFSHPKNGLPFRGIGNVEAGFLYNILKDNKPFALSLAMSAGLPTEKRVKGAEARQVELEPNLIIARQIGGAQVHVSFGAEISKKESAFNYNLATVFPFGNWRATFELNGEISDDRIVYFTPGLIWEGLDDFEFGLGIPKNIVRNSDEWGVILMITHEFSLSKKNGRHR